jgi:hypothetical protein
MLFANESASPLKESLAYSLVLLYFSLRRVSIAEYLLILRVCPHLLQMGRCTMATVSTACILRWVVTRTKGMVADYQLALYFELRVCVWSLKLFAFATLLWTWFVITLCFKLRCISMMLQTLCNMWLWLLNLYDLGLYVCWFEIRRDFTDYRVIRA